MIGLSQLRRLDQNNAARVSNFNSFIQLLDEQVYYTDFKVRGNSNYAFPVILRRPCEASLERLIKCMKSSGIEFRQGSAGGGNQTRQPYLKKLGINTQPERYPATEHVHRYGFYIGNHPGLKANDIFEIANILNSVGATG